MTVALAFWRFRCGGFGDRGSLLGFFFDWAVNMATRPARRGFDVAGAGDLPEW